MPNRRIAPGVTIALVAVALLLPIALIVILGTGALLGSMGDPTAGRVLNWVGLGLGLVWLVNLVALLILQALVSLVAPPDDHSEPPA
jgi:hypothetical protein